MINVANPIMKPQKKHTDIVAISSAKPPKIKTPLTIPFKETYFISNTKLIAKNMMKAGPRISWYWYVKATIREVNMKQNMRTLA